MRQLDKNLIPPPKYQIMSFSPENFERIGLNHLEKFINECQLSPADDVLEIGSGNGRISSAIARHLTTGSYTGIDIMKPFVNWCQKAYASYENFNFQHLNLSNNAYNKLSFRKARNHTFTFDANSFDFIYLTSVFTHMHKADFENYLTEVYRMLKPGKKCYMTYFLINDETLERIAQGTSTRKFEKYASHSYTDNKRNPESAIAFDQDYIERTYAEIGLDVETLRFGKWRNPKEQSSINHNQDYIIATKPNNP